MTYVECGNGHVYDSDANASCPYCNGGGNRIEFGDQGGVGRTVATGGAGVEVGATVAPQSYGGSAPKRDDDVGKTVGMLQKSMNSEPVVGWLICIEGKDKGKDYRIFGRNNSIGRSDKMDICIKGDSTITRENHARIGYDEKHNKFHLIPADATNGIYLNDEPVYVPTPMNDYDLLELGETKLVFLSFCNDRFTWKEGLKTGE